MDKTQNLTMWLPNYKQCSNVRKYNPFDVEDRPIIRPVGPQCIEAIRDEWGIELPIEFEEVAKLVKAVWPEEPGWKIEEVKGETGSVYKFRDLSRFNVVMFYVLARQGGAKKTEAKLLIEYFGAREGECLVESLYDRLWRCHLEGYSCKHLISAYAKIIRGFVDVLPEEKRGRKGKGRTA